MNLAFKILIFTFALNLATGIMTYAIVHEDGSKVFTEDWMASGLKYNESMTTTFEEDMNTSVNPSTGQIQDSGDASYRILEMVGLGFVGRFISSVDTFMFGFINILSSLFSTLLGPIVTPYVFGILKGIISIAYVLGAWALFTGKDIKE